MVSYFLVGVKVFRVIVHETDGFVNGYVVNKTNV